MSPSAPLCLNHLMSVSNVAKETRYSERTIRLAALFGELKAIRDPTTPGHKCWKFRREDVLTWKLRKARHSGPIFTKAYSSALDNCQFQATL
jgi:hypothetical protein